MVNVTLNASAREFVVATVSPSLRRRTQLCVEGPLHLDLITPDKIVVYPAATSTYRVIAGDDCPGNRDTATTGSKNITLPTVSAGVIPV